jgi:hypothetical protein
MPAEYVSYDADQAATWLECETKVTMKNFHNIESLSLNSHSSKGSDLAAESRFSASTAEFGFPQKISARV